MPELLAPLSEATGPLGCVVGEEFGADHAFNAVTRGINIATASWRAAMPT